VARGGRLASASSLRGWRLAAGTAPQVPPPTKPEASCLAGQRVKLPEEASNRGPLANFDGGLSVVFQAF
jgi:hypothetical protein